MIADRPTGNRPQPMPAVADTPPYSVPRPSAPITLKLDSNEGAPPGATLLQRLGRHLPTLASHYPNKSALEEKLAQRMFVTPEQVIVTAGGDDALDRACRAVLGPGREFIVPWPSFEMLPRYAALTGATLVNVDWLTGPFPTQAVCDAVTPDTAAIALVSPNNPTGLTATCDDLVAVSAAAPHALILVDLAYTEFADEDLTATALALPNAIAVRTFSKAWGLAGLRVGYAAGPLEYITWLRAAGSPYPSSSLSVALAQWRFELDQSAVRAFIHRIRRERDALTTLLAGWGAQIWPSQANFLLARFADADAVWTGLGDQGVAVRRFANRPELANTLRITCPGDAGGFEQLLGALNQIYAAIPTAFGPTDAGGAA
jgi:histidinol-phosphate aminotransferase